MARRPAHLARLPVDPPIDRTRAPGATRPRRVHEIAHAKAELDRATTAKARAETELEQLQKQRAEISERIVALREQARNARTHAQTCTETAHQAGMPYQRGQQWVRRFRHQAESVSAALAALVRPMVAADFVNKAVQMLEETGWVQGHRFLFEHLRRHLLGWPEFLAPAGIAVTMRERVQSTKAGSCPIAA